MPTAQSVMLAIHCKKTETVDLKAPLISYIRNTYSDKEADEAADDLEKVQRLRADVALMQSGAQPNSRETLVKYLRCLTAIETRFPISKDKGHAAVSFTWIDAFRPARKNSQYNIHYEKACVMFNLAALLSQQGLSSDRSSADGLTQACKLFQEAAGVFQYMREIEAPKADSPRPQDIATEVVVLLEKLMLTQAQECVYHKAVIDKKSPGVLSRLAKQTCMMYEEVDRQFSGAALATYFDKSWGQHASLKASIYQVEELIQAAKQYTSEDKVNFTIAILKEAFARLQNTRKIAKGINNDMLESVNKTQELVQNLLNRAEKDNSTIYLMKVPTFSEVPPTTGALLVKVVPPVGLNDASGEQLFTGLIPDSCAKAISKYTEMVDSLIRTQLDKLAGATDNARLRLREWELPDTLDALDARAPGAALPEALARDLEEISSIGGVVHLKGILAEIGELRRDVEEDLRGSQAALEADASADTEARTQFGDKWRTTPAATAAKPYWDRIMQYRSSLQKAGESDGGVIKRLDANEAAFADLNVEAAAMRMPRLQAPMVSTSPDDPLVVVARLRAGLEGLQSLASARAGMEEKLKEVKNTDNVLPKVMGTPPQQHEALFTQEIKKYDALCGDVAKNITAQDELLANVGRDNVIFRSVYDLNGWRAQCEAAAAGMKETVKAYRELLDHCSEGLRFYIGMAEVVKKARQECEDYAFTRQVQRDELKQDLSRRTREEESERLAQRLAQANIGARPPGSAPAAAPAYPNLPHGHQPGQSQAPPPPPPPPMQTAHAAAGAPPPPPPPPEYHAPQQQHAPPPPPPPQAPAAPQPHSAAPPPPPPQQQPGVQAQPPPQYYGGYGQPAGYAAPPGGYPGYAYAAPPAYGYAPPPPPPGAPQYAPPPPPPYYGAPQQPYYGYQHQQQ